MLVLTRRIGEVIMIGDDIKLTFLGVKGNQARFGFDAPRHINILRQELYCKINDEKIEKEENNGK